MVGFGWCPQQEAAVLFDVEGSDEGFEVLLGLQRSARAIDAGEGTVGHLHREAQGIFQDAGSRTECAVNGQEVGVGRPRRACDG